MATTIFYILVFIFALIGFFVVAGTAYFFVESWYYDRKCNNPNFKPKTDYDRGVRDGQMAANM